MKRLIRNAAKDFGLDWRIPRAYRNATDQPIDARKVLFVEASQPAPPEAFKVLMPRLQEDPRFDVRFLCLGKHRTSAQQYLANCESFAREAATARAIFLCDASDVVSCLPLRPGTDVVQLWHACGAFKRFGMSTAELGYGNSRKDLERHPFYGNLSLVTVSSPEVAWAYIEAMHLEDRPHVVEALGVSRTDLLFDDAFHVQALRHVYEHVPEALGKRIVLYAPTCRGPMGSAYAPEPPSFEMLKQTLAPESILLIKQHPAVKNAPGVPASCNDFAFDVSAALPIDELLVAADVLVTDYSSVVFEFSLFNRHMVFYAPDLDDYLAQRNFYYPFEEMIPGPLCFDSAQLAASLAQAGIDFDSSEIARFRQKFMGSCDGHATDRIINRVFAAEGGVL